VLGECEYFGFLFGEQGFVGELFYVGFGGEAVFFAFEALFVVFFEGFFLFFLLFFPGFEGDMLVLMPRKTRRQRKIVTIPLSDFARQLRGEGGGKGDCLFEAPADQTVNSRLKEIATIAGIKKRMTTHVGRHTFGFLYLLMGGKVEELREIMGHSKLETTMIYTHTDHDRKVAGVKRFDEVFRVV